MSVFLAIFLAFLQVPAPSLNTLVDGVARSFVQMKDFTADFVQVFEDPLNRKQQESGHLYLRRPRMMRWEYQSPEGNLFISDGKTVYFYVPADRQVNKETVRETFDDRIPLMFLLGRGDLRSEFTRFELLNTKPFLQGTKVVRMYPRRKTDLSEVVMEVDPANFQSETTQCLDSMERCMGLASCSKPALGTQMRCCIASKAIRCYRKRRRCTTLLPSTNSTLIETAWKMEAS